LPFFTGVFYNTSRRLDVADDSKEPNWHEAYLMRLCGFKTIEELRKRMEEDPPAQEWTEEDEIARLAHEQQLQEEERFMEREELLWEIHEHWLPPLRVISYRPAPNKGA
jgi:hypothetical protein